MPPLGFINLKAGVGHKIAEFRWPIGREMPSTVRRLTMPEFVAALELAATLVEPRGSELCMEENARMSKYIADIDSKRESKLETQMNEHSELLLSHHFLLKKLEASLLAAFHESRTLLPQPPEPPQIPGPPTHPAPPAPQLAAAKTYKPNRWQTHVMEVKEKLGVSMKEAMSLAKETYKK
jgi:hypothetical protein